MDKKAIMAGIIGDIGGSRFEFSGRTEKGFELFTDDTVMTCAIANAYYGVPNDLILKAKKF